MSGWSTDEDADALAALAGGEFGASLRRLTAPGAGPLAVPGQVRVIERFRSGAGGLRLTLAWPAGLRGTATSGPAGGVVRHGIAYAGPGEACVCAQHDCGGGVPVSRCAEPGDTAGPVLEAPRRRDPLHRSVPARGLTAVAGRAALNGARSARWRERAQRSIQAVQQATGKELAARDDDVADAVLLWFRSDEGDLSDALTDAAAYMEGGSPILLLTPKTGRDGYVETSEIGVASARAGLSLSLSKTINACKDWNGSHLIAPKRG
ncbi:DUF3052 family protein [Streptomyces sp. NPDC001502]|uniref:DUF3052 family protein n=1 Tax=Streptomyces sp. NPDC001502 TaxID=3364578 RepID=UPI00368647EF